MQERGRHKKGRMARLKGKVDKIDGPGRLPSPADHAELEAVLEKMRAPA
jgi:hypothetical protein